MLRVKIENKYGEQLDLTGNPFYDVTSVTGLTPPSATINTSAIATADGTMFNSSRVNERNIVLTIVPRMNIESSRINIYKYIKSKQRVRLYFANGVRDVWIDGYVENVEGDLYANPQKLQVSIICPDPFFKSIEDSRKSFSVVVNEFEFPFETNEEGIEISSLSSYTEINIFNASDDEVGIVLSLYANGQVVTPTIYNQTTNEHFTIEYTMTAGDMITVNTRRGEKSIRLIRDGVASNIINKVAAGSNWFALRTGGNVFSYTAAQFPENLDINTDIQPIFEGV